MREGDLEAAVSAIRVGGWGERHASLSFALRHPHAYPFVAESDGAIVGTSIATHNGPVGWVGLVFVAPEYRGRGLGGDLTAATLDCFKELGCRSVALAATELGQPVYERLGFRSDGQYVVFSGARRTRRVRDARLRSLRREDIDAVVELDRQASAEERAHLIDAAPEGWVLDAGQGICGFALRSASGLGPIIAPDPGDGVVLLEHLRTQAAGPSMLVSTAGANSAAVRHLRKIGFLQQRSVKRMVLGEPIPWQPTHVWSLFSFAVG